MTFFVGPVRKPVDVHEELGSGDEGFVLAVTGTDDVCLKVYPDLRPDAVERIEAMVAMGPPLDPLGDNEDHYHLTWPLAAVYDGGGSVMGFVQPRLDDSHAALTRLIDPHRRREVLADPTWRQLAKVAARIALLMDRLHRRGIVVGDVSDSNFWVSPTGHVTVIDCDSMQFRDPRSGRWFEATRFTERYAAPELLARNGAGATPRSDAFALALLLCELLMEGQHPFEGWPAAANGDASIRDNILNQRNRISHAERLRPLHEEMPSDVLPPELVVLASHCFGLGHGDPDQRPVPGDWYDALDKASYQVQGCEVSDRHLYQRARPACIWCERRDGGIGDHFPPSRPSRPVGRKPKPRVRPKPKVKAKPVPAKPAFRVGEFGTWPGWARTAVSIAVWFLILSFVLTLLAAVLGALAS